MFPYQTTARNPQHQQNVKNQMQFGQSSTSYVTNLQHQQNVMKQLQFGPPSTSYSMQNVGSNQINPGHEKVTNYLLSIPQGVNPYLDFQNAPRALINHGSAASIHSSVDFSEGHHFQLPTSYHGNNNNVPPASSNNNNKQLMKKPEVQNNVRVDQNKNNQHVKTVDNEKDNKSVPDLVVGESDLEKNRFFVGTIERVLKWHKIYQNRHCFYEVIAPVVGIQDGFVRQQKIMLLRDNRGPVLQVVYYTNTRINIEDFFIGQKLRCFGRMTGGNIMSAIRIKTASEDDVAYLQRHCCIADHVISNML